MSKECKNYTDTMSTLDYHNRKQETVAGLDISKESAPWMVRLHSRLTKMFRDPESKINEAALKKAIKAEFGSRLTFGLFLIFRALLA